MEVGASTVPRRGRPKTFDRDRVIDVAMDCYWREGTDAVPLNELCRRAQVSKPGIYREFGGEDGLMDAVLARYAETVLAPTWEQTTHDRPFAEVLATLVGFMTGADGSKPAGCLLSMMRVLSSDLGPATTARVEALGAHARVTYAEWVERAKMRGEIGVGRADDGRRGLHRHAVHHAARADGAGRGSRAAPRPGRPGLRRVGGRSHRPILGSLIDRGPCCRGLRPEQRRAVGVDVDDDASAADRWAVVLANGIFARTSGPGSRPSSGHTHGTTWHSHTWPNFVILVRPSSLEPGATDTTTSGGRAKCLA